MKYFSKLLLFFGVAIMAIVAACNKKDGLATYANGNVVVLTASTSTVAAASSDSSKNVLALNWTSPKYATDTTTYKFIVQIDSSGRNFSSPVSTTITGKLTDSITGKQINDIVAGFGASAGKAFSVDIRIVSSYANNNEQYTSNIVTIKATPYIVPITVTASSTAAQKLAIANAANTAVSFNWNASQFGATTINYALQMDTVGGNFANPQVIKYATSLTGSITVSDLNTAAVLAGIAAGQTKNAEFRIVGYLDAAYTKPAVYSNVLNISITTYLPFVYLYVPGDYQGWDPSSAPAISATVPSLTAFEGYINIPSGGSYEFKLNPAPNWNTSYGTNDPITLVNGVITGDMSLSGANNLNTKLIGGGYYRVNASTTTNTWTADKTTWAMIGDATPNGWGSDTPMTFNAATNTWTVTLNLVSTGQFKFRANSDWNDSKHNFGVDGNGNLAYNAGNISVPATGNYTVTLNLSTAGKYSYTLKKN